MYRFNSDYTEGCHPAILERLAATNMDQTDGYGLDPYCDEARAKIKAYFSCPNADVHFLVGGGYFFGNIPVIKQNFTLVTLGIVIFSVLPVLWELVGKKLLHKE